MRPTVRFLLVVLVLLGASVLPALADCSSYNNSSYVDYGLPYGGECVGTGGGCVQCYTPETPGTQGSICTWSIWNPGEYACIYFSQDIQL